jgi:hypothetical protein
MSGGLGHDTLRGRGGNDGFSIDAEKPADPPDLVDGGEGSDSVAYEGADGTATVDLAADSDALGNQLVSVENAFTGVREATVRGDEGPNSLGDELLWHGLVVGRGGDDELRIVDGTLRGGAGDDLLQSSRGVLDGGSGDDRLEPSRGLDGRADARCGSGVDTVDAPELATLVRRSCEWLVPDYSSTTLVHQPVGVSQRGYSRFELPCVAPAGFRFCKLTAGFGKERYLGYAPRRHRSRTVRAGKTAVVVVRMSPRTSAKLAAGRRPVTRVYVRQLIAKRRRGHFRHDWDLAYRTPVKVGDQVPAAPG